MKSGKNVDEFAERDTGLMVKRVHATVLSNFARGFDKYRRSYSKSNIPESTYPEEFYLLDAGELEIGLEKAQQLKARLAIPGDEVIVLETQVLIQELKPNLRTGVGEFVERDWIRLESLFILEAENGLGPISIEEAFGLSMQLLTHGQSFSELVPRSLSVLPIARGCQARCPFCFSGASVSEHQPSGSLSEERLLEVFKASKGRGATRLVITGGGEPTLLPWTSLLALLSLGKSFFSKVVLITNGYSISKLSSREQMDCLRELDCAGLNKLCISRHHYDREVNAKLMGLDIAAESLTKNWLEYKHQWPSSQISIRWICVLQKDGVRDSESLKAYLDWAVATGVSEVCFKELYVASSAESVYHDSASNLWSRDMQVPLSLVVETAEELGWPQIDRLPWGAPVFRADWAGATLKVAAYTEPTVGWEFSNGLARSFNLMADGTCLASLEDQSSEIFCP